MRNDNDIRIEGIGSVHPGSYHDIRIEGMGTLKGEIEFERLRVMGIGKVESNIEGKEIVVEGTCTFRGDVRTKQLKVSGIVKSSGSRVYADKILIEGYFKGKGEVSADVIQVDGIVNTDLLSGDCININARGIGIVNFNISTRTNKVDTIECTTLSAKRLTANTIRAHDVHLKGNCHVENLYCDGTLRFDRSCKIRHIEGDCTVFKE